jgi:hypothetical protein
LEHETPTSTVRIWSEPAGSRDLEARKDPQPPEQSPPPEQTESERKGWDGKDRGDRRGGKREKEEAGSGGRPLDVIQRSIGAVHLIRLMNIFGEKCSVGPNIITLVSTNTSRTN